MKGGHISLLRDKGDSSKPHGSQCGFEMEKEEGHSEHLQSINNLAD
jgi:hypothetical protein